MTDTHPTPIIEATGLTTRFGEVVALDGLDLVAPAGQVVGLLGPNGAGKSTFIRSVATLVRPDAGELRVAGVDVIRDPRAVRRLIGLAGQAASVEEAMTGRENLIMVARLFGLERRSSRRAADRVLEQLGLSDAGRRLVRTYSGGMRRRLDLGASLVGRPRLLLLDEPTTGLDPRSRTELWQAIRDLVAAGTDVLLTTQYLEEADQLADQVVVIDQGRVIAAGTPSELKDRAGQDVIEVRPHEPADVARTVGALATLGAEEPRIDDDGRRVRVTVDGRGGARLSDAVRALDAAGIVADDIALRRPTLDEVFLTLTDQPATDDNHTPAAA